MAIYMLVPTEDSKRLARIVSREFADRDRYILPNNQACLVVFDGSSQEIAERLDLQGTNNKEARPCPVVITMVTTYGGYAPTSLWEWLNSRVAGLYGQQC